MEQEEAEKIKEHLLQQLEKMPEEQVGQLREQIENASPEEIEELLKSQAKGAECVFCGIASGNIETVKIYENDKIMAFLDINPANLGHILVIPKEHFQFIFQLPDAVLKDIFLFVKKLMPILINVTKAEGISVFIAQGIEQNLPHLAINLIPRFSQDKIKFAWERKKIDKEELEKTAKEIEKRLEREKQEEKQNQEAEKKLKSEEEKEFEAMVKHLRRKRP